eukprot:CAMPEP_0205806706 /NCGR_PEP_ID=MMETSP0205-20121125/10343_1 /ASSEMBLY_ACC=CAM_ASM_000278 /TAXON_ID=36767 /ORGANISM="Euplotes focardii, Strain TN1" /LENGTH=220 /DNA_ID=CAMNT_0053080019 /DNA_START=15 /DNA_END=677 /DNA_ORIENTATION=-
MSLKFWWDPISQPSRSVKYALIKSTVDYEENEILVIKDTRSEDYKNNVNPFGKVPTIHDDDLKLYESATQLRYILDNFCEDESLLPRSDLKARAKVDFWLDWNNTMGRPSFCTLLLKLIFLPKVFKAPLPSEEETKDLYEKVYIALTFMNQSLEDQDYLAGGELSIGDVQVYNELYEAIIMCQLDLDKYTNVAAWVERVGKDQNIKNLDEQFLARLKNSE